VIGVASIMSTSRGVVMWNAGSTFVIVAAFLWGAPWRKGEARRILRAIQRIVLFVGLAIVIMISIFPDQIASRYAIYYETLSPDSPRSELAVRARDYPLENFMFAFAHERWPYGHGIGTFSLGMQYVVRIMHAAPMGVSVESGYGQLILELGILGLILWIFLSIAVSVSAWKAANRLRGTPWFPLAFVIFWYAFLLLGPKAYISFVNYQDYLMNSYLWILLGILFRLPQLAQETIQIETSANLASANGQA